MRYGYRGCAARPTAANYDPFRIDPLCVADCFVVAELTKGFESSAFRKSCRLLNDFRYDSLNRNVFANTKEGIRKNRSIISKFNT